MTIISRSTLSTILALTAGCLVGISPALAEKASDYKAIPPFLSQEAPPLVMLVMGKNHKLYYEAYNDASDLDEDGTLDIGYRGESEPFTDTNADGLWNGPEPYTDTDGNGTWDAGEPYIDVNLNGSYDGAAEAFTDINGDNQWNPSIDYYGYFDSYKCYTYSSTNQRFEPTSAPIDAFSRPTKKCAGLNEWSGDLLNYLTMSRMDALRKVLYGGTRSVDDPALTVLRRVYIPQDAHTWGKEYENIAVNGFDIREYSPLDLPTAGSRHLFASTTLSDNGAPILRVLPNNIHRIWEWVAKERPVADTSLETSSGSNRYEGYPDNHTEYEDLVLQFATAAHLQGSGPAVNGVINGSGDPFDTDNDYYLNIFDGQLNITTPGTYEFAVDGDDAVELLIDGVVVTGFYGGHGRCNCTSYSGSIFLSAGVHNIEFRHQERGGGDYYHLYWRGTAAGLDAGTTFQIVPATAFVANSLVQSTYDVVVTSGSSTITDYQVQVEVCNAAWPERNCRQYPSGDYKPIGLLQRYGESDRMYFGLMSGSYEKNTKGGVLRKNIKSLKDEIDLNTGQLTSVNGIIQTINNFRITRFRYPGAGNYVYSRPDGGNAWVTTRPMVEREFPDWGNPVGEMMYETLRYFAGKNGPTSLYDYDGSLTTTVDAVLGLNKEDWINPYVLEDTDRDGVLDPGEDLNGNGTLDGFESCSKPFMLVLSDIYPTYDSDDLPGSYFDSFTGDMTNLDAVGNSEDLNVETMAQAISTGEGIGGNHYIGNNQGTFDGACTPKNVSSLADIQGLCPEEPTKLGSYYSGSIAYYGMQHDISSAAAEAQRVATYTVGLASPLPNIKIQAGTQEITLVPFAKSVGGASINPAASNFQPTNTIVDFFVESITPTTGKFRINYEDVEQGADHDMDAIVEYDYMVNPDNTLTITLNSTYAAGGIIQHMGYIISGTTADGVYLEVRDFDTAASNDPDYFLDTPPTILPGTPAGWADTTPLPLTTSRTFTPSATGAATLLKNPLWYAAKWGGFIDENTPTEDSNDNGILDIGEDANGNGVIDYTTPPTPDLTDEWDQDNDGNPDSYFYVVNALRLEEQLNKSFAAMLSRASSGTAASVISNSRSGEGAVYQSIFYPTYESNVEELTWIGEVHSLFVDSHGNLREDTDGDRTLDLHVEIDKNGNGVFDPVEDLNQNGVQDTTTDQIIVFTENGIFKYEDVNENEMIDNEDNKIFTPDIPSWHDNGILDTEDEDGDGILTAEDLNCDGILNRPLNEDSNGNGYLDSGEDLNSNNQLDYSLNEDANGNGILDSGEDLNGDGLMNRPHSEASLHIDTNGDGIFDDSILINEDANNNNALDHEDINCNGILDFEDINNNGVIDDTEPSTGPFALEDILYLWAASDWLNDNLTFDPLSQRTYTDITQERHILTFVDSDNDMVVDPGEQVDFISQDPVPVASLTNPATLYPYLTLYPSFADEPSQVNSIRLSGAFPNFLQNQAKRQIDFIRGADQPSLTLGSYTLPAMRNRRYEAVSGISTKLWRLGDIVHSTPTVVAAPAENFHLLYRDRSYARFLGRYQQRRTVVYVGGNDGMLHAFNGGFFNTTTKGFTTTIPEPFYDLNGNGIPDAGEFIDWDNSGSHTWTTNWELGSELWAYVPYNLLPHLYWLTEQDYPHVYFMDMKPKIFDAKIFVDSFGAAIDDDHPDGWGTVMAIGMRLGGGQIQADMDKSDGVNYIPGTDRTMRSAIILLDITNPERTPRVLAEIALDDMGYTTSYPAVVVMRTKTGSGRTTSFANNDWYLLFGSGPAEADGSPGKGNSLNKATSEQTGKVFMIDLKALMIDNEVRAINTAATTTTIAAQNADPTLTWYFQQFEANSFISQPVTVDYQLNFDTDAAYFGSVIGDHSGWGGKMRRIVFDDEPDYSTWHDVLGSGGTKSDNVLFDLTELEQPIVSPASIALDTKRIDTGEHERWIYFGTGRFYVREDAPNIDQQSYYGIKEPSDNSGFTWAEVSPANLLDVSLAAVYNDQTVENVVGVTDWDTLINNIDSISSGWFIDFPGTGERNLGGPALLGELLTFTTYLPSQNICNIEGYSNLYALYYKTGTAYFESVIGSSWIDSRGVEPGTVEEGELLIRTTTSLGKGLAESPNIHTGGEDGSKAYVQTSTGAIVGVEQQNPGRTKSGKSAWQERK